MKNALDHAVIEFSGKDVRQVLQGQTTRNFLNSDLHTAIQGAFCDVKGRVLTDFCAVFLSDTTVLMRVHETVADALLEHLKKYLMFSKTTATKSEHSTWGFEQHVLESTSEPSEDGIWVSRQDGLVEYWGLSHNEWVEDALNQAEWQAKLIASGDAQIVSATWGAYLPQDLNYDLRGLIDFDKGCYTGQEIIARLHYRGTPKRRLAKLSLSPAASVAPGDLIRDIGSSRTAGSIVLSTLSGEPTSALAELAVSVDVNQIQIADSPQISFNVDWLN